MIGARTTHTVKIGCRDDFDKRYERRAYNATSRTRRSSSVPDSDIGEIVGFAGG